MPIKACVLVCVCVRTQTHSITAVFFSLFSRPRQAFHTNLLCNLMVNAVQVLQRMKTLDWNKTLHMDKIWERSEKKVLGFFQILNINPPAFFFISEDSLSSGDDEDYDEDPEDGGNENGEFFLLFFCLFVWCLSCEKQLCGFSHT